MSKKNLGLKRLESMVFYVSDLERSRQFYQDKLDFRLAGTSGPELEARSGQRSMAFTAGQCTVVAVAPQRSGTRAWRYLEHHPEGVGTLVFEVEDARVAFDFLEARGATPIDEVQTFTSAQGGTLKMFSVTSPFGSSTFRFVERRGYEDLFPGFVASGETGPHNRFGVTSFDHVTSNFETMKPALLWLEHVMGFERFWGIEFHTNDVAADQRTGSGLRSVVMTDPHSGLKFANNEPCRPFFARSQVNLFTQDQGGDGIQHVALAVEDILATVRGMQEAGVNFMQTPGPYYDALPERLEREGVGKIDEDIEALRALGILVDGAGKGLYMLQIFLEDGATLYGEKAAGPFFLELIQRKGDELFGGGNFRALFESIEDQQRQQRRV